MLAVALATDVYFAIHHILLKRDDRRLEEVAERVELPNEDKFAKRVLESVLCDVGEKSGVHGIHPPSSNFFPCRNEELNGEITVPVTVSIVTN